MLEHFFKPSSIAIIGASEHEGKIGNVIMKNLVRLGFRGGVYPVNPHGGTIENKKVYARVADIPTTPDCAIIVVPAPLVSEVLAECGKKKIRAAIIVSSGFKESGKDGAKREQLCLSIAKKHRIRLLGPNCLGLIIPQLHLNASFAEGLPEKGDVAVVSQSGAMAVAITDWALESGLGFSSLISLGNKGDVNEFELLKYYEMDRSTRVIVMYLESLAVGRPFLKLLNRVTQKKPVIILMPGKSTAAQTALFSHTGSLAGSYEVTHAALSVAGAIVVTTLEKLFMFTSAFSRIRRFRGDSVAVVTNAGGPGIVATDALIHAGCTLAALHEDTKEQLQSVLPPSASLHNPVDVVGDAPAERYVQALSIVAKDKNVQAIVALLTHQYVTDAEAIAKAIVRLHAQLQKPILVSFIGGKGVETGREILERNGVFHIPYPEQAAEVLLALKEQYDHQGVVRQFPETPKHSYSKTRVVLGKDAERLLSHKQVSFPRSLLVRSVGEALKGARKISYPLVAKVMSSSFVHKTDAHLVKVNIINEKQLFTVLSGWQAKHRFRFKKREGFLLQSFIGGALEVFVGAKRDPLIGPYCIVGLGGIFVESLHATLIEPLPLKRSDAIAALSKGPLGKVLASERGKQFAKEKIILLLLEISRLMMERPKVLECDVNPVLVTETDAFVADMRVLLGL